MTFGPSSGWVFCGADERRNIRSHFRHRFCRCAPLPPRTDRKKGTTSEPAPTSAVAVAVTRPPESKPVTPHRGEKARDDDDDDDDVLPQDRKHEKRQRLLPSAVECRILALLDLASHVSAMRASTAMRRLCAQRLASPRVVALTGMCRKWRGSYLHSYADGDDAGRRSLDDEEDAPETRLVLPWFERRYRSRGRLPDPIVLSDAHALLKRQWAPRVLDLYAVRFGAASFEALLHATPTVAVLCADASHVPAIATVVGRHLPALVSLHIYDGFRHSGSPATSSSSAAASTESVDSYGDWRALPRLVSLALPLTIELAAHFSESESPPAVGTVTVAVSGSLTDSKRSASASVVSEATKDSDGDDGSYLPPTLERLTLTRAETTHLSRQAPALDYKRLFQSLPRLRHFRTAQSMPGVDALRAAASSRLETLDGGQFSDDDDRLFPDVDADSAKSSSSRVGPLCVRRLDWRTSNAHRPHVYVTEAVAAPHRVERMCYSVESLETELDLRGGRRRGDGMTRGIGNVREAVLQLTSFTGLRHLMLHGATPAINCGVFESLCSALLRLERLEVSGSHLDGEAFDFRQKASGTTDAALTASASSITPTESRSIGAPAPPTATPPPTMPVTRNVRRNPTEAFFAPLKKLAALRRLDFHNMPRRGGCSYRRDFFPSRAATASRHATAPKEEIWHLPPLPQLRDYRQLHWTASVAAVLTACPELTTLHISFEALVGNTRAVELAVRHATLRTLRLENPYAVEDRAVEHGIVALILKLGRRRMRHGASNSEQKESPSPILPRRTLTVEVPWCHNPFPDDVECGLYVRQLALRRHRPRTCVCAALSLDLRHCLPPTPVAKTVRVDTDPATNRR